MEENKDRFRMYGLVPYNVSRIQAGIQFSHALQEYNNMLGETYGGKPSPSYDEIGEDFNTWRLEDKTVILLNGGTSVTMEQHIQTLKNAGIHVGVFREPDLNDMVTGIVFLVPEQVYKRGDYPDFKSWMVNSDNDVLHITNPNTLNEMTTEFMTKMYSEYYTKWLSLVGGERNAFLKGFTSQFNLA